MEAPATVLAPGWAAGRAAIMVAITVAIVVATAGTDRLNRSDRREEFLNPRPEGYVRVLAAVDQKHPEAFWIRARVSLAGELHKAADLVVFIPS